MIGNDVMFELADKWLKDLKEKGIDNLLDATCVISSVLIPTLQSTNNLDVALTELSEFHDGVALSLTRRMRRRGNDRGSGCGDAVRGSE
jgi:hypothetical protein